MAKFDTRKLMEKAIDVMRESMSEPRLDGKASPMVGAVNKVMQEIVTNEG